MNSTKPEMSMHRWNVVQHELTPSMREQLRAELETAGTPINPNDTWIAAEALHHKLILVTDNMREFERVPKLNVENWLQ